MDFIKKLVNQNGSQKSVQKAIIGLILANVTIVIIFLFVLISQLSDASNKVYMITSKGDIFAAQSVEKQTYRPIEAKAHARLYVNSFYNINKDNYNDRIRSAFNLGGQELVARYEALKQNNTFVNIRTENIVLTVQDLETEIFNAGEYPYNIRVRFKIICEPSQYYQRKIYRVVDELTIRDAGGERTELNPHNMFIDRLVGKDWTDITSQES